MCSPSALRPETIFSFASEPITRYACALHLVFGVVEATLPEVEGADIHHVGIITGDRPGKTLVSYWMLACLLTSA